MPRLNSRNELKQQKRRWTQRLTLGLLLAMLLLIWPTASDGQDAPAAANDAPRMVLVDEQVLIAAREDIDFLDRRVAKQDSLLVAQREYYVELLVLKDQHIKSLQEAVEDALPSPAKDFLDKLIWGLAGYGLHAAGAQ